MKRVIGVASSVVVAAALMLVPTPPLRAQGFTPAQNWGSQPRAGVCFYLDTDYRGESFCANVGENQPKMERRYNDEISSIRVFGRVTVVVFDDENYGGASRRVTGDVPNLGDFNDRISSFQVLRSSQGQGWSGGQYGGQYGRFGQGDQPQYGACFYVDADYRGDNFCLNSGESLPVLDDRFNDKISSIRLFGGVQVVVYKDGQFGGAVQTILQDTANLGDFNDEISSALVAGGQPAQAQYGGQYGAAAPVNLPTNGACFYLDTDYRGESFCMNSGETMPTLEGRYNDRISSVRVFGGARVIVYENEDYSGENRAITRDVPDLGSLNDRISSVRVR